MPLVSKVKIVGTGAQLPTQRKELEMQVESGYYNNQSDKAVRLYSGVNSTSQVYVLQKETAKELYDFLKRTFNF